VATDPPQSHEPAENSEEQSSRVQLWVIVLAVLLLGGVVEVIIYGYLERPGWIGVSGKQFWDYLDLLIVPAAFVSRTINATRASKPPTRWVRPLMGSRNRPFIPRLVSLPAGKCTRALCTIPAIDVLPGDRIIYATGAHEGAWQSGRMRWS
jgi:hypothetical protein